MDTKVILLLNDKSHELVKVKDYSGGGKHNWICPKCSLYNSHFSFCWRGHFGTYRPLCSILAEANNWDNDFLTCFKEIAHLSKN